MSTSTSSSGPSEVLPVLFDQLRSKNPDKREQAAQELRDWVAAYSEDNPADDTLKTLWNDVNSRIFAALQSPTSHERRGGLAAIDKLLDTKNDVAPENLTQRLYRFYHYLKPVLPCSDPEVMVAASKVFGRIAKIGGVALGERFFEYEVNNALELMRGDRQEIGRYASVLILYQLATNAPSLFMGYVTSVLDQIWIPLKDHRVSLRSSCVTQMTIFSSGTCKSI